MMNWLKRNRTEALLVLGIIILAAFLRFYQLPAYMTFLGDEGRDALMIKRILVGHDLPLLGPPTSVGNMYLGPLYYYMMAVPMAIFWLNPAAAAAMDAVIGVLTVMLVYYLGRQWFDRWAAALSALLYAVSPVTIIYSRSSWNPNPAPFFALLAMFGLYKARQKNNFLWFILTGASLAFALQMHYLAIILLPVFGLLWIFEFFSNRNRHFWTGTLGAAAAFLALMSPLVIFDFRHNFINYRAFTALFTSGNSAVGASASNLAASLAIYQDKLIGRYIAGENPWLSFIAAVLVLLPLVWVLFKKDFRNKWPFLALGIWLTGGIIGISFYKQSIYDHYLGFLNPAPFLLLGGATVFLKKQGKLIFVAIVLLALGFVNLAKNPLLFAPNNQLPRTQEIAKFVISQAGDKPFNFALIAASNYDAAYQFYLEEYGHKPKVVPIEVTDQLFVVCEDEVCQPVGHPKYEIAGFGWTKIDWEKDFDGVKVFRLVHNPADPNFKELGL